MRPAVFLDRDGVINQVVWRGGKPASPRTLAEFVLEPGATAAVAALDAAGVPVFVVTNQPDVRRGLLAPATLEAMAQTLRRQMPVREIVACPHDDRDDCACRKPRPGMLLALAARHGVALAQSWLVGDQDRDMQCGRAAGCGTIQLIRDYNSGAGADFRVADLAAAVDLLLQHLHRL